MNNRHNSKVRLIQGRVTDQLEKKEFSRVLKLVCLNLTAL